MRFALHSLSVVWVELLYPSDEVFLCKSEMSLAQGRLSQLSNMLHVLGVELRDAPYQHMPTKNLRCLATLAGIPSSQKAARNYRDLSAPTR
jgi:hypothetical protein